MHPTWSGCTSLITHKGCKKHLFNYYQLEILRLEETLNMPDELYGAVLLFSGDCFKHFKRSPHLIRLFRGMMHRWFAVKLKKRFEDEDTSSYIPSAWWWVDNYNYGHYYASISPLEGIFDESISSRLGLSALTLLIYWNKKRSQQSLPVLREK